MTHLVGYIPLLDSTGQRKQRTPVAEIQKVLRVRKVDGSQVFARGRRGRSHSIKNMFKRIRRIDITLYRLYSGCGKPALQNALT